MDTVVEGAEVVVASQNEATADQTINPTSNVQMGRIVKRETILNSDESIRKDISIGTNEYGGSSTELLTDQRDSFLKGEVALILVDESGRGV